MTSDTIPTVGTRLKQDIAVLPQLTVRWAAIFLVVTSDVVRSSAGLNFIVQLENKKEEEIMKPSLLFLH